jgi:hypothetical protein
VRLTPADCSAQRCAPADDLLGTVALRLCGFAPWRFVCVWSDFLYLFARNTMRSATRAKFRIEVNRNHHHFRSEDIMEVWDDRNRRFTNNAEANKSQPLHRG